MRPVAIQLALVGVTTATLVSLSEPAISSSTLDRVEIDFASVLVHYNRSVDWVEGTHNNYMGLTYYWDDPTIYTKGGTFINSYGDPGGVLGWGRYLDSSGSYLQGLEFGFTRGYKDGEGTPIFLGYAGKYQLDDIGSIKLHVNPMFTSVNLSIRFSFFD